MQTTTLRRILYIAAGAWLAISFWWFLQTEKLLFYGNNYIACYGLTGPAYNNCMKVQIAKMGGSMWYGFVLHGDLPWILIPPAILAAAGWFAVWRAGKTPAQ